MASTLFALGYHEQIENGQPTPAFLQEIRKAAFARAYSADKNVSIFLGRPPRILKKYSRMDLIGRLDPYEADYVIDTRWSALCAVLKEEVLDLPREVDYNLRLQKGRFVGSYALILCH